MKKIIVLLFLLVVLTGTGGYIYQMHMNHNFETVTEGKVYKSGVIPPDQIADYVKKYKIKSIIDLRFPGTDDTINNPEVPEQLIAEREAVKKISGLNYFNNGSKQVPQKHNLDYFFKIMDNPDNYPILIHCYHGVGRAEMYTALYRIEYENMDRDEARNKARFITKWSPFDLGKPKGDFLHTYISRKDSLNQSN
jgi:protein tyrosine/serine phosphatase